MQRVGEVQPASVQIDKNSCPSWRCAGTEASRPMANRPDGAAGVAAAIKPSTIPVALRFMA
jgi:hypothetical protein